MVYSMCIKSTYLTHIYTYTILYLHYRAMAYLKLKEHARAVVRTVYCMYVYICVYVCYVLNYIYYVGCGV
jgi:hypothetical protein